jgi:prophage DNA circulation protein
MAEERSMGSIGGIPLEMEDIGDSFESAIARYDYPYADGSDLEDMGQRTRLIRVRAYFYDNAETSNYSNHLVLIGMMEDHANLLDFEHPKYGLVKGKIDYLRVRHDDRERCAEVDIDFLEQMRGSAEPGSASSVLSTVEEAYAAGQDEQAGALSEDFRDCLDAGDASALDRTLDAAKTMYSQVQDYTAKARAVVGTVERCVNTAQATVNAVLAPVNSLHATLTYAANIPGRVVGTLSGALEKTARLCDTVRNFPSQFVDNLDLAMNSLEDAFEELGDSVTGSDARQGVEIAGSHLKIACAQRMALEVAQVFQEDAAAAQGAATASDTLTALAEEADDYEVMTLPDLEKALAVARRRLDDAVEAAREMQSLKDMAAALLDHVNAVRLERESMQAVRLDNAMPLHLVCLKYGLPYTDAERLLKVNQQLRNPNFSDGEVLVYVR